MVRSRREAAGIPGNGSPAAGPAAPAARCWRTPSGRARTLWVYDPNWPELVHPFASAVDTPLPRPPERDHIMLDFAAPWCEIPSGPTERQFPEYPDESLADWDERHGLRDAPDDG